MTAEPSSDGLGRRHVRDDVGGLTFTDVVRRRRMVRQYRPQPVDPLAIERILDVATRGPSAGFSQPHRFVVVTGQAARLRVADACDEPANVARGLPRWLSTAPVHIIPCIDRSAYRQRYAEADKAKSGGPASWPVPFGWVDGGAALMLLLLAVVDEGLSAGFLAVDPQRVRVATGMPASWSPIGLVTVGHGQDDGRPGSQRRDRLPLESLVHRVG